MEEQPFSLTQSTLVYFLIVPSDYVEKLKRSNPESDSGEFVLTISCIFKSKSDKKKDICQVTFGS